MKVRKTHILQLVFIHCGFRQISILNWLYIINIYTIFDFEHCVVAELYKNFIKFLIFLSICKVWENWTLTLFEHQTKLQNFQVWSILHKLDTKRKLKYKEMMKPYQTNFIKENTQERERKINKEPGPKSRQVKESQRDWATWR
jgi:hypothetical protein